MISNAGGGQMLPVPMNNFIQANLAEIWIDVEYVVTDFSGLFTAYRNGATAPTAQGVHAINVASPVQDPGTAFLRSYGREMTGKGRNRGAYSNPAVETAVNAARGALPEQGGWLLSRGVGFIFHFFIGNIEPARRCNGSPARIARFRSTPAVRA
jgi:ABC-type transport system substrate-binding protein